MRSRRDALLVVVVVVWVEVGQRVPCMWISVASFFMLPFLVGNLIPGP